MATTLEEVQRDTHMKNRMKTLGREHIRNQGMQKNVETTLALGV